MSDPTPEALAREITERRCIHIEDTDYACVDCIALALALTAQAPTIESCRVKHLAELGDDAHDVVACQWCWLLRQVNEALETADRKRILVERLEQTLAEQAREIERATWEAAKRIADCAVGTHAASECYSVIARAECGLHQLTRRLIDEFDRRARAAAQGGTK